MLGTGTNPTPATDCVGKPLVFSHLGETHRPLPAYAHGQSPAAGIWLLHVYNLEGQQQSGRHEMMLPFISVMRSEFQQRSWQSGNAVVRSPYLSHWNNDMALTSILAGETQVVLREAYLPKGVKMAEGHPQEAFMHFQQVFLFGKPEKCPELLALGMSFKTSAKQQLTEIISS